MSVKFNTWHEIDQRNWETYNKIEDKENWEVTNTEGLSECIEMHEVDFVSAPGTGYCIPILNCHYARFERHEVQ